MRRSLSFAVDEVLKIIFNVFCFIGPVAAPAYAAGDATTLAALVIFVVAAVPIGPDRHACLCGVRRENIFHYLIGVAALLFAKAF